MSFSRYPEYKDSGVEWLGQVPSHWVIDRIKRSIKSCRNGIWGDEATGDDLDIPCVRVADFDRTSLIARLDEPTIRNVTLKEREGRLLQKGNLLLEKSGGGELQPVGCVVLYDAVHPAVCSNFVAKMELMEGMSPSFWRYLHAAAYSVRLNVGSINQTSGIQNLDQGRYFDERVAFPPANEQQEIAKFLETETGKIDVLINEQEKLIALLKEKRQAVISNAVTKGCDPSVPMKDSGIEWLGEVPAHWDVSRVKYLVEAIEQGWSPQCEGFPVESDDEWGVLKVGCVNGGTFSPSENKRLPHNMEPIPELGLSAGDVLISRANTRELVGSASVVDRAFPRLMLCDKIYRLRVIENRIAPKFISMFLGSIGARSQIELSATGASSSMLNISQSTILDISLAIPGVDEQIGIIQAVEAEVARLDALIEQANRGIELLKERRGSLISSVVTGKIKVF